MQNLLKLGYWNIRGLGFVIRPLLEYLKVPYQAVEYVQDNDWFPIKYQLGLKFPNLPYLIDGNNNVTETVAILRYLCRKYDESLLGKTLFDQADVDMLLLILHNTNYSQLSGPCYSISDKSEIVKTAVPAFKPLVEFLGKKQYIIGDYITVVDLYFVEILDRLIWITDNKIFQTYPTLKGYHERLNNLSQIKAWKSSDRWFEVPFNGFEAKINNLPKKQVADLFFQNCEKGKGWEACNYYCADNAKFSCDVLPQTNIKDYTEWNKSLIEGIIPDGKYELISCSENKNQVIYCATFSGTHSLNGGPVPPSNPPKKIQCDYSYILTFNEDNRIVEMRKIWDALTGFQQLGWPLPDK